MSYTLREVGHFGKDLRHLQEMSNFRKNQTGLPVNIWVDEAETYKKGRHSKRIKFQLNKSLRYEEPTCPMKLNGEIPKKSWIILKNSCELDSKELECIKNFVVNNSYTLEKLADQEIWKEYFIKLMIKGGEKATEDKLEKLKQKVDKAVEKRRKEEERNEV